MPNRLIIVESPSKAKTLGKFLGSGYTVKASMGHIRDLPKSKMGVDVDKGFQPEYVVIEGKEKQIRELKSAAKAAEATLLAADPDREGEAIAWHLAETLGLKDPDRIVFHEITKNAVESALSHPRKIDRALVAAQEARRVIDRLVGYQLSPLLWRKVRTGLSAGRVQSVAVRLVVDREAEIAAFVPVESWTVEAMLSKSDQAFRARLLGRRDEVAAGAGKRRKAEKGEKNDEEAGPALPDAASATAVAEALGFSPDGTPGPSPAAFVVEGVDSSDTSRSAPLPYTTSTMQQDASTRLRFSPRRTMSIAQQLYEGVELGSAGSVGLITYMRTDSVRISDYARDASVDHITAAYGADYVRTGPARTGRKQAAANVQDAHEAIRPTDVARTPESVQQHLRPEQFKLYDLIWRRFVASQMASAKFRTTRVTIGAGDYIFRASGSVLVFDGFQRVWKRDEEKEKEEGMLPALAPQDGIDCSGLALDQHFTQPPPRYTEASLIKELEERGIGRPSTYAPTIETVQERNYIRQEDRRLYPTELGKTVDLVLREHFPDIVDVDFTVALEKRLDAIEAGQREYEPTVREWYSPFAATVSNAERNMQRVKIPARETGEQCPECNEGQLVVREGRFGEFVGCSRYPECKYIKDKQKSTAEPIGEDCPQCGKPLVQRTGRRGPFIGCSGYPTCRYIRDEAQSGQPAEDLGTCPDCGKPLGRKMGRRGPFIGCTGYPSCKYIKPGAAGAAGGASAAGAEPTGETCPECGKPIVRRRGRFGPFESCSGYPECKYRPPKKSAVAS